MLARRCVVIRIDAGIFEHVGALAGGPGRAAPALVAAREAGRTLGRRVTQDLAVIERRAIRATGECSDDQRRSHHDPLHVIAAPLACGITATAALRSREPSQYRTPPATTADAPTP